MKCNEMKWNETQAEASVLGSVTPAGAGGGGHWLMMLSSFHIKNVLQTLLNAHQKKYKNTKF